jgi:putative ABC transport system substrate-binding protein
MNPRRRVLVAIVSGAFAAPLSTLAQLKPARVYRVGILSAGSRDSATTPTRTLAESLGELGYVAGKNLVIEARFADAKYERMPQLVAELVGLKLDVLVTAGTPATLAAKKATATLPIVMMNTGDAVGTGLIASLARPGGNITGTTIYSPELMAKRLELLKEAVPQTRRVAALLNPANPAQALSWQAVETAAKVVKVEVQKVELRTPGELEPAFAAMAKQGIDAVVIAVDTLFAANARAIADLATKHRLPGIGPGQFAGPGLLLTYGTLPSEIHRRTAYFIDRILKGAKPADLPVELPTRFELIANLKTAKALGITIASAILTRADKIIE